MSSIHLGRIRSHVLSRFGSRVDFSDIGDRQPTDHQRISRGLSALVLQHAAGLDEDEAAASVTDGFDDNGIDALHYKASEACLYVVQSKWSDKGGGSPSVPDVTKFLDGVRDLVQMNMGRFNPRIQAKREEISTALDDVNCTFRLILAHTGTEPLSIHAQRPVDRFLKEYNDPIEIFTFDLLGQRELHQGLESDGSSPSIELEILLREWGHVQAPYVAFYGQVDAFEMAQWWRLHRNTLFARNLRMFLSDTAINKRIADTLKGHPENFWYFNNGVTLLCTEVKKKPLGGGGRDTGVFVCRGVSVVNGAQTVGAVGRAALDAGTDKDARVLVRLISLQGCPADFGRELTMATNTQNRIESRDFAALDPQQDRLARELKLDGVVYAYKAGQDTPVRNGFTIEDATVALACSNQDLRLAVMAKGNLGRLWEDTGGAPYRTLFHEELSARDLWDKVSLVFAVQGIVDELRKGVPDFLAQVLIHGNRFILRQVFRLVPAMPELRDSHALKGLVLGLSAHIEDTLLAEQPGTYLAWTFKNYERCRELEAKLDEWMRSKGHRAVVQAGAVRERQLPGAQLQLFGFSRGRNTAVQS